MILLVIGQLALAEVADALVPKHDDGLLESLTFVSEVLQVSAPSEDIDNVRMTDAAEIANTWDSFRVSYGDWSAVVDQRTGKIESAEGEGIPFLPGRGNQLQAANISTDFGDDLEVNLARMEVIARAFLPRVAGLLGVDPSTLILNQGRSGHPADYLWFVDFDVTLDGMPVEGARVVFRVNNGNLIQFGSENLPAEGIRTPEAKVARNQALKTLAAYIGGFGAADSFLDGGSQRLIPVALADSRFPDGFERGKGRGLARVWQFIFRRDGDHGTWRARVDATSGKMLEFRDINDYATSAQVTDGLKTSLNATEALPLPFADVSTAGSNLNGRSVKIFDTCGWINFAWLTFHLTANVNLTDPNHVDGICNTSWSNAALSLDSFRKGSSGCSNSGEIQGVYDYAHRLDTNDDTDPILREKGKGETSGGRSATSSRSSAAPEVASTAPADRKGTSSSTSPPRRCGISPSMPCPAPANPHPAPSSTGSGTSPAPPPPQHSPDF